ncbi:CZB domain-containing protein [Nibribacter koreensis]|uniref:Chemoreceptor zinc-binding domain-containing protein n=1 Tax=Nibribacter koreensis TaxID=1084519 RepID=A0ABP8FGI7_9BACT
MIEKNVGLPPISSQDFEQARIKHVLFKSKLRALLYGASIDPEPVINNHACALGQWIQQVAFPQLGDSPELRQLDLVHDQLHDTARHLYQLYKAGRQDEAIEGLTKVEDLAEAFLKLLSVLEKKTIR